MENNNEMLELGKNDIDNEDNNDNTNKDDDDVDVDVEEDNDDDDDDEDDEDIDDDDDNDDDEDIDDDDDDDALEEGDVDDEDDENEIDMDDELIGEGDSLDDDDEYMDINYLQKFNKSNEKIYLEDVHHEKQFHNYDEILKLAVVTRDENNIIIDDLHKTIPILTKYEVTKVLGQRIKQLNAGAKPFINIKNNILDNYFIAKTELEKKSIPFIIRRPLPNKTSEYWHLKDLEILTN